MSLHTGDQNFGTSEMPPAMLIELLKKSFADVGAAANLASKATAERDKAYAVLLHKFLIMTCLKHGETHAHIQRVGAFSAALARLIGQSTNYCDLIEQAGPLHDIGKTFIPDSILKKPGALTADERAVMELHVQAGEILLRDSGIQVLDMASNIARCHHEKYDGSGYPAQLRGDAIPLEARIVALVDVFDALTSDRVYRKAIPLEQVLQTLRDQAGQHFDPKLVAVFIENIDIFLGIRDRVNHDVAAQGIGSDIIDETRKLSALLEHM